MPQTIKPAAVKYLRIETPNAATAIDVAGARWAGVSEVPASSLSAAQLETLRKTEGIKVSEAEDRPADPAA
jgi:hypothetical protein